MGRAWAWLVVFTGGMTLAAFLVWGSLGSAPTWFHALYAFQTLFAVAGVVGAYKKRDAQTPE